MSRRTRNRDKFVAKYGIAALGGFIPGSTESPDVMMQPDDIPIRKGGWPKGKPRKPKPATVGTNGDAGEPQVDNR